MLPQLQGQGFVKGIRTVLDQLISKTKLANADTHEVHEARSSIGIRNRAAQVQWLGMGPQANLYAAEILESIQPHLPSFVDDPMAEQQLCNWINLLAQIAEQRVNGLQSLEAIEHCEDYEKVVLPRRFGRDVASEICKAGHAAVDGLKPNIANCG